MRKGSYHSGGRMNYDMMPKWEAKASSTIQSMKETLTRVWEAHFPVIVSVGLLALFAATGKTTTLTCTRVEPEAPVNCLKQVKLFWKLPLGDEEIPAVRGARIESMRSYDGTGYRVELLTAQYSVPLTDDWVDDYLSAASWRREAAARINAFVQNTSEKTLVIKEPAGLWAAQTALTLLIGIVIVLGWASYLFWRIFRWARAGP